MDLNSLFDFGRKLDFGSQAISKEFRTVASFFFRLSLMILFFWYFAESIATLWPHHGALAYTLIAAAAAVFITFFVLVAMRFRKFAAASAEEKNEKSSVLPFLLLNLPFVLAVESADLWCGHRFPGGLLGITQDLLRWIIRRFS